MCVGSNLEDGSRSHCQAKNPAVPVDRLTNVRKNVARKDSNLFRLNDESVGF